MRYDGVGGGAQRPAFVDKVRAALLECFRIYPLFVDMRSAAVLEEHRVGGGWSDGGDPLPRHPPQNLAQARSTHIRRKPNLNPPLVE